MRAATLGFVLACSLATSAKSARADAPSPLASVDEDARFVALVRDGDKARAAGKLSDAVLAYRAALDIKNDPVVSGRLGLVALEGGALVEAVGFLLRGMTDGQAANPAERRQVREAYDRARSRVCRLYFSVSQLGAKISIDGTPEPWAASKGEFYLFVKPGPHVIRAQLPGYEDAVETIDAPKGKELQVDLVLKPLPNPPELIPPPIAKETPKPISTEQQKPIDEFPRAPHTHPLKTADSTINKFSPWSIGLGPVVVAGAVSQWPAFGFGASIQRELSPVSFARFDVRGALSPVGINEWPIRGVTFGVIPAICARRAFFLTCLEAQIGTIGFQTLLPKPASVWTLNLGIGGGLGLDVGAIGPLRVRAGLDAVLLLDSVPVKTGGALVLDGRANVLWTGPPVLAGFRIEGLWNLGL